MASVRHAEAVVVGGGPAGSTTAAVLARAGRRVLLVERQRFPRFHIGESLLPASAEVLRTIGVWDKVCAAGFVEKHGASFYSETEELGRIEFAESREVADPVTFQVTRDRFDQILLDHARESGAEVAQGCRARSIEVRADGVRLELEGSANGEVHAPVVVDASGQAGFLARRLGLRTTDARLRNLAIHSQFDDVARHAGPRGGDIRLVSRRDLGWIWLIPLSATRTSVGVVLPPDAPRPESGSDEEWLETYLSSVPALRSSFENALRVAPVRRDADFAYEPHSYAGDRWLMAGDAGSFLDPVFSTGVHLALESGLEAARAIDRALATDDFSAAGFRSFARVQRKRYEFFRRLVHGFYDPSFRDLLLPAEGRFGIKEAVIAALSGLWRLGLPTRLRLEVFFAAVAIQSRLTIAPRRHPRVSESSFAG